MSSLDEKQIEVCAEAAHEVNRVWCKAHGDTSQTAWDSAPDWQKESAIKGVKGVLTGNTPAQSHAGWLQEKAEQGWKYGKEKDVEKKEHPCFVPYNELPPEQKMKDTLFVETVKTMAKAFGFGTTEVGESKSEDAARYLERTVTASEK